MASNWKPIWLLIVDSKVHSSHLDKTQAISWKLCKEHDGSDTSIIMVNDEDVLLSLHDKLAEMFKP